jgi:RHS repeat-associated protein
MSTLQVHHRASRASQVWADGVRAPRPNRATTSPASDVTHYEYGPFGELLRATGPMAKANPFTFQTEYWDQETDKYYWKHRYYDPNVGRWLSRDPIEEKGGLNLYGFLGNDSINKYDYLGLACECKGGASKVQDDAGASCCKEKLTSVSLNTSMESSSGHTSLEVGNEGYALYPDDESPALGYFLGWPSAPQDPSNEPSSHVWNPHLTQKYKVCPSTLKKLKYSISVHSIDNWGIFLGETCTSWACKRLKEAGLPVQGPFFLFPSWPHFMPDVNPTAPIIIPKGGSNPFSGF